MSYKTTGSHFPSGYAMYNNMFFNIKNNLINKLNYL